MGSFKKIFMPIYKGVVQEIKARGMKRAMTFTRILVDAMDKRIDDECLTKPELRELGKITKSEAHSFAAGLIEDGLEVSGAAANSLISFAVKSKNAGVPADEIGIKASDEDLEDDIV